MIIRVDNIMESGQVFIKRLSRWLKKREFLSYYLLLKNFDRRAFNVGDAIDLLIKEFCMNRKTAVNIIKRLYRCGFIVSVSSVEYRCMDVYKILDMYLNTYKERRLKRCRGR